MDPATLIGVVVALLVVVISNVMEGGNPAALIQVAPMLLVFGATLLISLAGGTMADAKGSMRGLVRAFTGSARSAGDLVPSIVKLAEKARREGLLALEDELKDIDDPFLVRAVTFAIDGTDPEELREILESEVLAQENEDKQSAKFWAAAGGYAPTIGIVGTVMGLVHVLENLAAPEELGRAHRRTRSSRPCGACSSANVDLPADRQPPEAARRARGGPHGAGHRGRRGHPVRLEPARRRPAAALAAPRRAARGRGGLTWPGGAGARRKHDEEHENHERWLVTYADMLTLLMVLFIVMFAMSSVDEKKFNALTIRPRRRLRPAVVVPEGLRRPPRRAEGQTVAEELVSDQGVPGAAVLAEGDRDRGRDRPGAPRAADASTTRRRRERDRLEAVRKRLEAALRKHGLLDDVRTTHRRARARGQPGLAARGLRRRRRRR